MPAACARRVMKYSTPLPSAAGETPVRNVDYGRANQALDRDRANALSFIAECAGL